MDRLARIAIRLLLACAATSALVVAIALARALLPTSVIFDVTATTERIEFDYATGSTRRWVVQGAAIVADGKPLQPFSGSIEVASPVRGFVERIALGDLWLHLECADDSNSCDPLVRVFGADDRLLEAVVGSTFDVHIGNIREDANAGRTTLLTLTGAVVSGRPVGVEVAGSSALLREGTVSVLVPGVFSDDRFEASRVGLAAGDHFRVIEPDTSIGADGFVLADERPALTVAYRVAGQRGSVVRPGGGRYEIRPTRYQRIVNDEFFRSVMGVLAFIGAVTAPLSFWRGFFRKPHALPPAAGASVPSGGAATPSTTDNEPSGPEGS